MPDGVKHARKSSPPTEEGKSPRNEEDVGKTRTGARLVEKKLRHMLEGYIKIDQPRAHLVA
jgi:hypothetical protein